jgi:hypothetical protein
MGMPEQASRWTADMVRALPDDGNRYEVVDGELLVTPAPTWSHEDVVGRPDDERPEILAERISWQPEGTAEPLTLELPPLFARIHGERL